MTRNPQMALALAQASGIWNLLRGRHRLALLLAALCHDVDHPGVSAAYLRKAESRLAAWFRGDPGLLERHHSVRAFEMLASRRLGLLAALPTAERVSVRGLVRDTVLATDMSRHGAYLAEIEAALAGLAGAAPRPAPGQLSPAEELACLRLLVKCADVSNVTKRFGVAAEWGVMATDEMFLQGDRELADGLEVRARAWARRHAGGWKAGGAMGRSGAQCPIGCRSPRWSAFAVLPSPVAWQ